MAGGLSSNWKKLQDRIKQNSSDPPQKRQREKESKSSAPSTHQLANANKKQKRTNSLGRTYTIVRQKGVVGSNQPSTKMGNSHSSHEVNGDKEKRAPLPTIDAQITNIPASETVADVYRLGLDKSAILVSDKERPNEGLAPGIQPGKYIALDCEMVGIGEGGHESALARVSAVDYHGTQVYDSYVKVDHKVTDWRTAITGITPKTLAQARPYAQARQETLDLLHGRIVVGHDLIHDIRVLDTNGIPAAQRRDTAIFGGFKKYGHGPKPKLRDLSSQILGIEIHQGHHSSIQDARIAMALFRRYKQAFDLEHVAKHGQDTNNSTAKGGKGKKNPKKRR